jgi:lysophospholipase
MAQKHKHFHSTDHTLESTDGESSVFVRTFLKGKPDRHFLIVHGALEHSGRHMDLVEFWMKNYTNVMVTVFDHVGHGRSGGTRAYVPGFKVYIDDLLLVGKYTQTLLEETSKTFICSHSLGGLITLTCFLDTEYGWPYQVSGLIFSSPCVKPKQLLGSFSDPLINKLNVFMPKLHIPMIQKGSDLTNDPDRANDFDTDSLIPKFISIRMIKEILEASHKLRGLSYYMHVPSLFLVAGDDCLVDPESTILFAHGIAKDKVVIESFPHDKHELWNEVDRVDIFRKMKLWADRKLKETV